MSDKKRTVTTIETHEVWIIRRAVPEISEEVEMSTPHDAVQPAAVSHSNEADNGSETQLKETADIQEDSRAIGLVGRLDKTKKEPKCKNKSSRGSGW
jgi:hypothetical protein